MATFGCDDPPLLVSLSLGVHHWDDITVSRIIHEVLSWTYLGGLFCKDTVYSTKILGSKSPLIPQPGYDPNQLAECAFFFCFFYEYGVVMPFVSLFGFADNSFSS